jgi:hypothetical protein
MALSDILTVPFLVSLGITLVIVGLVGVYFMYKFQEQNHKISSMFGLVTTMAEEMNFIRSRLQQLSYQEPVVSQTGSGNNLESEQLKLIPVSDDENDSDSEESDLEENESSDEDDSESESESLYEELEMVNADSINFIQLANDSDTVKVINFAEVLNKNENDNSGSEDLDDSEELNNDDGDNDVSSDNESENDDENEEEAMVGKAEINIQKENLDFIKSIDISNLAESSEIDNSIDYKKMSLNKLKSVAVSKGLLQENSKATKNAILKLLGSE